MHFLKEGQKIRAWVDPLPLIRAMPERKRFFSMDLFPYTGGWLKKGWKSRIFLVSLCWRHCCRAQFITITSPWVHFNTIWEGPLRPSTGCKKLTIDCKRLWRMCRTLWLHRRANRQIIAVSSHFLANNPQVLMIQIQTHLIQIISVSSPKTDNANTQICR